jgi:hypothetical protein
VVPDLGLGTEKSSVGWSSTGEKLSGREDDGGGSNMRSP